MLQLIFFLVLIQTCCIQSIIRETSVLTAPSSEEINYYPNSNSGDNNAWKFLQKYTSFNPVVLLIDDVQECHDEASSFLKSLRRLTSKIDNVNFILMKFNSSGASEVLETTKNNSHRFGEILNEKMQPNSSNFLGQGNGSKSAVFFGILKAAYVLPPRSGIIVFMKREIGDEAFVQHAMVDVGKKQIQVFVIWGGKKEEPLLKELTQRSHGAFLRMTPKNLSKYNYETFLENLDTSTSASLLLSQKNLRGTHNLDFPIDSDVTGIHINITPNITQGVLTTPKGYNIDVLDEQDVSQFSAGSFINREDGVHEIHLNTMTTQSVGVWHLRVGYARALYNITIFAHTKLTTNAMITTHNYTGEHATKIVKFGLTGDISSIDNISFVSEDGNPLFNNIKFSLDKNWENYLTENIDSVETNEKKELSVNVTTIPKGPFYAIVNGKDSQGNDFRRLSYVRNDGRQDFYLPPLTVEMGLGSELITQPYRQPQLFFEVTNNGNTPTLVRFLCRDDRSILQSMVPWYRWINSQETATVRVTLTTRPGTYQDFITFTASGTETVSKKVIVDVGMSREDRRDPELDYHYKSDCTDVLFGACEDGLWTVEVKAKDRGSGLLQVSSIPRGIFFPNGFTTGTTEEVKGVFSESCCNPDLKLVAVDRHNNRRTRNINAYRANLGPGAIAAIVIGVLLLILIIIGLVILIRWCRLKRGQKGSFDLPVYRGPRRS